MAIQQSGLGKGLGALFRENEELRGENGVNMLALTNIEPNPRQPRKDFNDQALKELADSIKSQGLLQPLLVRPIGPGKPGKYEIVAGERRWRAAQLAGLSEVPVHVRSLSEQDTLIAALVENLQREDLNPVEEAFGLQLLKDEFGYSQDEMAQKIGKSRSAIANSLRLLALPDTIRDDLAAGRITSGHGRALLSISDDNARTYLRNLVIHNHLSVRETEGQAAVWKQTGSFDIAPFNDAMDSFAADIRTAQDEEVAANVTPTISQSKSKPQSARLLEIQTRIGELLRIPVKVTGKDDKGRISFSYNSKEELEAILERFVQQALEGTTFQALEGNNNSVLTGTSHNALTSHGHDVLDHTAHTALNGRSDAMLDGTEPSAILTGHNHKALEGESAPRQLSATTDQNSGSTENPGEFVDQGMTTDE